MSTLMSQVCIALEGRLDSYRLRVETLDQSFLYLSLGSVNDLFRKITTN